MEVKFTWNKQQDSIHFIKIHNTNVHYVWVCCFLLEVFRARACFVGQKEVNTLTQTKVNKKKQPVTRRMTWEKKSLYIFHGNYDFFFVCMWVCRLPMCSGPCQCEYACAGRFPRAYFSFMFEMISLHNQVLIFAKHAICDYIILNYVWDWTNGKSSHLHTFTRHHFGPETNLEAK